MMTEDEIRQKVLELDCHMAKQDGERSISTVLDLLAQFLVDVHRIADAAEQHRARKR
jgi:hypothetical protein